MTCPRSIDFDQVADLYDSYVRVDFDIEFWKQEAFGRAVSVLELMCGTGRLGLPLVDAGVSYTGLDYCQKQVEQFQKKLAVGDREARLVCGDARSFDLENLFDLVFIGFSSLSEIVDNQDKIQALRSIGAHLKPGGRFTFSLHNPNARSLNLAETHRFDIDDSRCLEFSWQFQPPSPSGLVTGVQRYVIRSPDGRILEQRELELTFHMISKDRIEALLPMAGFRVAELWGDYDRSKFTAKSPFLIYRCTPLSTAETVA